MSQADLLSPPAKKEWQQPDVQLGDRVVIARGILDLNNPESHRRYAALVTQVNDRTIIASVIGGRRMTAFHAEDPRVASNPQWLAEDDTGVWRLADSERIVKDVQKEIDALQAMIGGVQAKVMQLSADMKALLQVDSEDEEPRRGPGRPRKATS